MSHALLNGFIILFVLLNGFTISSASTANTTITPTPLTPPTSLTIIHHLITLKLTSDNFLLRKHKLFLFERPAPLWLDVTAPPPPQVITFVAVDSPKSGILALASTG